MKIVRPEAFHLESYLAGLKRESSLGGLDKDDEERSLRAIAEIESDPDSFLAKQDDPGALGGDIKLPDGSYGRRIPSLTRWMWDGEACGSINFRWQPGTTDLPPSCFGHIGYSVFPWKRKMGYATKALRQILPEAIKLGLPFVELTTAVDNLGSQKVIRKNRGVFYENFVYPESYGGKKGLRFRIYL